MRFIFNFIFFGILFYLIFLFFPEVFKTLVSWAEHTYTFLKSIVDQLVGKVEDMKIGEHPVKELTSLNEAFIFIPWILRLKK